MTSTNDPEHVKPIDEQIKSLAAAIETQQKVYDGSNEKKKKELKPGLEAATALLKTLNDSKNPKNDEPETDEDD